MKYYNLSEKTTNLTFLQSLFTHNFFYTQKLMGEHFISFEAA